jgi:hypothetical protein
MPSGIKRVVAITVGVLAMLSVCCRSLAAPAPAAPATQPTIEQKTKALAEKWRAKFAQEKFNMLVAPPFVLAGDGTPRQLAGYRDNTVLSAAKALGTLYFKKPLEEPVLILLFETEEPYKRLSKKWFDDDDVPHYGFYRHNDHAMLMNVSTGTGTLVHELTHALIAPDFPTVPDWFNEGLASLYEQSQFGPDARSIKGLPNWRLPGLQKAIKEGTLRTLPEMIGDDDFRADERVGINYAEARYLMLYLQEKNLLQKYYNAFRAAAKEDPTGLGTLRKLVAPRSMEAFEKEWRAWVMTLRFER